MIKLIVFDWDDVFSLGSKESYFKSYDLALKGVGVRIESEEQLKVIKAKWGKYHKEIIKDLLREHPELVDQANEIYEERYRSGAFVKDLRLVDGAVDLLKRLRNKYALAIATGADPKVLKEQVFPKFDIPEVFSQIIHASDIEDTEKHKPHPHMLQEIMKNQNILPSETVFVGDAMTDVQMAQAAGVIPIVVLTGQLSRKEAKELGVKYIVEDVTRI